MDRDIIGMSLYLNDVIFVMIDNPAEYDDFAVFVQSYNGFDISMAEKVEQAKN